MTGLEKCRIMSNMIRSGVKVPQTVEEWDYWVKKIELWEEAHDESHKDWVRMEEKLSFAKCKRDRAKFEDAVYNEALKIFS